MKQVFKSTKRMTFREADPAQIMFFGNIFGIAHDAFEEFIQFAGYSWDEWFKTKNYITPIRHAESDYFAPFLPGQEYEIAISVKKLGESSFQIKYVFSKNEKKHAELLLVHAVADRQTMTKMPMPDSLREKLTPFLEEA